jgi:general secretion pathway protein G
MRHTLGYRKRTAFSVIELLAVVTILGIIAAIIVPRVAFSSDTAKAKVDAHNRATINSAVERWYIEKGTWPNSNLTPMSTDLNYFPSGVPKNPVTGANYTLNNSTHRVN